MALRGSHDVGEQSRSETAVERTDTRAHLTEDGVVGGDGQVAHDLQDVAATDRVPGHHCHHRFGQPPDLHLQIGDVKPAHRIGAVRFGEVSGIAADALIAARTECPVPLAGQDDHADRRVLAGVGERVGDLDQGLRPEGVVHLRPADHDPRDAVVGPRIVDVLVTPDR